jgi:hypothetical protein
MGKQCPLMALLKFSVFMITGLLFAVFIVNAAIGFERLAEVYI